MFFLKIITGYKSDHKGGHSPGRHRDDQGLEAEQDHAGLNGRVLGIHEAGARAADSGAASQRPSFSTW